MFFWVWPAKFVGGQLAYFTFQGPVAGKLVDNYGPRWPILAGSFLHIFGLMMTSISTEYYQIFLAQGVCSAIGCSFLFYPSKSPILLLFLLV
jgi:MFS family permease